MLHLHRAERADVLVEALCGLLATGLDDPFTPELICVPSRGVERWITQQLALVLGARPGGADGICANVEFPSPGRLTADLVATLSGVDARSDPWRPGRSVWPLLSVIESDPQALGAAGAGRVGDARFRQYAAARHVAELFDAYGLYRPGMIADWAAGEDADGCDGELPADLRWQPRLWRRLQQVLGVPSPAERLGPACQAMRAGTEIVDVPERLSFFGLTRLPPGQFAILDALAEQRDVHLWLLHPSAVLWERIAAAGAAAASRREHDPSAALVAHPLLSSLGRDVRELQLTVAGATGAVRDVHHPASDVAAPAATVLGRLQQAITADARVEASDPFPIEPGDRTVQIHSCHGRSRQVEVVRDVILGLLAADPSLEPRDILVMCPDIETFAPLISATFGVNAEIELQEQSGSAVAAGQPAGSPAALLRVRLADRSLRQTNPVMNVAAVLLELVDGRMAASEVLDFAAAAPVRRRFGFDDDDFARLTEWVGAAEVRWGIDGAHRAAFQLGGFPQNTWEAGLDRLLLGVTMAEGPAGGEAIGTAGGVGWVDTALPLDDVDSTDIDLVGRLAELVDRLRRAVDALTGAQPLAAWIAALDTAVASLTDTAGSDAWQPAQFRSELTAVLEAAGSHATGVTLSLTDIRHLLADRLRGRPTRANFRTGSLTMCTLVPMRSVPHRVICLIGLDDGAFPRQPARDGDNLLLRSPLTGERDERSEDRQLFLDAILAAQEHLVITYTGADERTNSRRPPAVPVGELIDTAERSFDVGSGTVRDRLCTVHPLQPFDPKNFAPEALGCGRPFSFDRTALDGAKAMMGPRLEPRPFLERPLPAAEWPDLELDDLRRFFDHPVRGFFRQRLNVSLPREQEQSGDQLPIELNGLAKWQIGERMLAARLSGLDATYCRAAEWRRGALPPGKLGQQVLADVAGEVEHIVGQAQPWREVEPAAFDVAVQLSRGRRLVGTVGNVYGTTLLRTSYGKIDHKRRFGAWLTLLLLSAARPDEQFAAVVVGRASSARLGPVTSAEAVGWLCDLVDLYEAGLREPLPLASKTSFAYAEARRKGAAPPDALRAAAAVWDGGRWGGECGDPAHVRVYGDGTPLAVLCRTSPSAADGTGDWPDEPSRFAVLSRRWWAPMFEGEYRAAG